MVNVYSNLFFAILFQGYFDALRTEHHMDKINVTVVCPGIFSSNIFNGTMTTKKDLVSLFIYLFLFWYTPCYSFMNNDSCPFIN